MFVNHVSVHCAKALNVQPWSTVQPNHPADHLPSRAEDILVETAFHQPQCWRSALHCNLDITVHDVHVLLSDYYIKWHLQHPYKSVTLISTFLIITRKRAIAKALHLEGRTTLRQSFWVFLACLVWKYYFRMFCEVRLATAMWSRSAHYAQCACALWADALRTHAVNK